MEFQKHGLRQGADRSLASLASFRPLGRLIDTRDRGKDVHARNDAERPMRGHIDLEALERVATKVCREGAVFSLL